MKKKETEEIKFTQEVKDNWLKALRSGDYTQGEENLSCDGKHCCLGVLAEITEGLSIRDNTLLVHNNEVFSSNNSYGILSDWFGEDEVYEIWMENDRNCDEKYTSVIPLIEELEVQK